MSAKTNNLYTLLKADEKQVRKIIIECLKDNGYDPVVTKDFIYAEGTVPVMLLAHYDTVPKPPRFIKNDQGILTGFTARKMTGLGADDRAGIYAILKTIENHHCHVLFTGGEEIGGVGARAFVRSEIKPEVNYCLQFDRRGENDAVYYDGYNEEFEKFITSHGWATAYGTFTDICVVCPHLGVMGVNLSIGYKNEHRQDEMLDTKVMNANIERIPALLDGEKFEYKEPQRWKRYGGRGYGYGYDYGYGYWGYADEVEEIWNDGYVAGFDEGYAVGVEDGTEDAKAENEKPVRNTSEQLYYVQFRNLAGHESVDESIGYDMFGAVGYFLMIHNELTYDNILSVKPADTGSYVRKRQGLCG